jgi:ParB/RepB/Spo0J family partition protein
MQTKLEHVKLTDITVSDTNVMFRDESEMTDEALKELIDSVREKGVIQPVLIREMREGTGDIRKLVLICGERRYRAAKAVQVAIKDRDTIPANIREMTDEEAFELQVTENLQRKDVHPLKEAKAYKYLVDKDPKTYTAAELALRFGKSDHYIITRLKLNDLSKDVKKDYLEGKMSLAAALAIARLSEDDQLEIRKNCQSYGAGYRDVKSIEQYIESSIMCNLSGAPFKKDDATLNPSMGPCTTCQFRTGANQLFSDIKQKDRCMNKTCFKSKRAAHLVRIIKDTHENKPDVVMLGGWRGPDPEIEKLLKDLGVKALKEYDDYNTGEGKAKGLVVAGDDAGKIVTVKLKKQSADKTSDAPAEDDAIKRIKDKMIDDAEKDADVVFDRILKSMEEQPVGKALHPQQEALLIFEMYQYLQDDLRDDDGNLLPEIKKMKLPDLDDVYDDKEWEKVYKALTALNNEQKSFMASKYLQEKLIRSADRESIEGFLIRKAAIAIGIPVKQFEKEQELVRADREGKAQARIADLKAAKKEKAPAKTKDKPIDRTQKGLAALVHKQEVENMVNGKKKPASGVTNVPKFIAEQKKKLKEAGVNVE